MANDFVPPADWEENPPHDLETVTGLLQFYEQDITKPTRRGKLLRELFKAAQKSYNQAQESLKELHPLAFWEPSYEQALLLNAWVWGINFPLCFAANRIGKTTAFIVNALLWLFPNNPQWLMFQGHRDEYDRWVQVIPRPNIAGLLELQQLLEEQPQLVGDLYKQPYEQANQNKVATLQLNLKQAYEPCWPKPPIQQGGQIWLGAPDSQFHQLNIMPKWRKLLPKESILSDNQTDKYFIVTTQADTNPKTTTHQIICKSYESEDTKWSGDAVQGIVMTEGFTQQILDEVKLRLTNESFASWDYTPADARNTGQRTALAYKVYKKEEQLPLRSFSFVEFGVDTAPERIIPKEKKADMIRVYKNKAEGKARIHGKFFSSSGLILEHLNKQHHCLQWNLPQLLDNFPGGQFYRAIDPGLDHPTACAWGYLTNTNTWFIYRFFSKRGTTIPERCKTIIQMSNNEREEFKVGNQIFHREIHPYPNSEPVVATIIDWHTFKEDETTGTNYSLNYVQEGLVVTESIHMGPEDRAVKANSALDPNAFLYSPHPVKRVPPGSKAYFLINEPGVAEALEKFDNLFWDRYKAGDNRGQPKDKVQTHNDDELDAFCYLVDSPYVWTPYKPPIRLPRDTEPEITNQMAKQAKRVYNHGLTPEVVARMQERQLQTSGKPGYFG